MRRPRPWGTLAPLNLGDPLKSFAAFAATALLSTGLAAPTALAADVPAPITHTWQGLPAAATYSQQLFVITTIR